MEELGAECDNVCQERHATRRSGNQHRTRVAQSLLAVNTCGLLPNAILSDPNEHILTLNSRGILFITGTDVRSGTFM